MVCQFRKIALFFVLGLLCFLDLALSAKEPLSETLSAKHFYSPEKTQQGAMAGLNQACELELNKALSEFKQKQKAAGPNLSRLKVEKSRKNKALKKPRKITIGRLREFSPYVKKDAWSLISFIQSLLDLQNGKIKGLQKKILIL